MRESGTKQERISIPYFEGVNSTVQQVIARRSELSHSENARAPMIGVLEKREGQETIGEAITGGRFNTFNNYGLAYYEDGGGVSQGLIRVTSVDGQTSSIYFLNTTNRWQVIDNDIAMNRSLSICDTAIVEDNLMIVNGVDPNIMIVGTVGVPTNVVSSSTPSSIYNSPSAKKATFYKGRIYLANYLSGGEQLKTTVLRSSYAMGLVTLINGDVLDSSATDYVISLVDTKYIYTVTGMNGYEIYRGNQKVATVFARSMTETSMTVSKTDTVFEAGFSSFLSSDEVWILGTYIGPKQYRWVSNASTSGRNSKQYDTFKLNGGDEDEITLLETIGNTLMIANKNAMMTWNDYTLESFDLGVGNVSPNGYVKLKGCIYFLHYSGVYSTSGTVPQLISRKIERYIKGATKSGLENAAAGFKGLSVFFAIGDVTLYKNDGSLLRVLEGVCLEYNVADQNWYVHTGVTSSQFLTYMLSSGQERLTMCSVELGNTQETGTELLLNGTFDGGTTNWILDPGWSYTVNSVTLSQL